MKNIKNEIAVKMKADVINLKKTYQEKIAKKNQKWKNQKKKRINSCYEKLLNDNCFSNKNWWTHQTQLDYSIYLMQLETLVLAQMNIS